MLYKSNPNMIELFGTKVPEPRVLIDFLGFETHVKQIREKRGASVWPGWYSHAAYYIVDISAAKLFGPGEEVSIPSFVKAPDYEFEIGCYVTKQALLQTQEEALEFFKENCYLTILNDWSARDIQKIDMLGLGPANSKFIIGNSIGPKLVPAKDIKMDDKGVLDMSMTLRINGEERTKTNYKTLYHDHPDTQSKSAWSFPRLMAFLGQQNIAVEPGYLLGSGTVGNGCIAEFSAKVDPDTNKELEPAKFGWLKDGDVVSMEVEGIGTLENKVRLKQLAAV